MLSSIASRYGVEVNDGRFIVGCKAGLLRHSIWSVAQCSNLLMAEVFRHHPSVEDESAKIAVGSIITDWGKSHQFRVQRSVNVAGETAQHTFDFIAASESRTIAINVLNPGSGSLGKAQRYGFQGLDIRESYKNYKKKAVLSDPSKWSLPARGIISRIANRTVDFTTPMVSTSDLVENLDSLMNMEAA